ncbi:hypothetical protein AB0I60_11470 [Actinosynnema sp. NPDC050436]|uniref:lipopolysaccharide biosynthesis protein n=1 Tax=Actinosynnema sp. NPDC050436 TaxID=3155659 RepID=UPI0033C477EF
MTADAADAPAARRPGSRSLGKVTVALAVASVLGYGLLVLCGRVLGPADYRVFITFWGVAFGLGSAISPIEQEVSRLAAEAELAGRRSGADVPKVVAVAAGIVAVFGALLFIPGVNGQLFPDHGELAAVTLGAGLGYAVLYAVRGLLVGHGRITPYAGITAVEPTIRAVVAVALVVAGLAGITPLAVAVAAGTFAWLVFAPRAARLVDVRGAGRGWGPVARTTSALMAGSALTATVVTAFPAMVNLLAPGGDPAEVGSFLSALTLARFPLVLLLPVQAMAVPAVVRLVAAEDGRRRLAGWLVKGGVAALVVGAVGTVLGALLGPWLVRLVFGPAYVVAGWAVGGLVLSSVLLAAVQLLAAVLVAFARPGVVLRVWACTAVSTLAVLAWWPADAVTRAVVGLLLGSAIGAGVAFVAVWRQGRER